VQKLLNLRSKGDKSSVMHWAAEEGVCSLLYIHISIQLVSLCLYGNREQAIVSLYRSC
jgi:hypothetical protein